MIMYEKGPAGIFGRPFARELPGGILASVSIAECILESGYGKSELALGG